jgi:hypothetical protein
MLCLLWILVLMLIVYGELIMQKLLQLKKNKMVTKYREILDSFERFADSFKTTLNESNLLENGFKRKGDFFRKKVNENHKIVALVERNKTLLNSFKDNGSYKYVLTLYTLDIGGNSEFYDIRTIDGMNEKIALFIENPYSRKRQRFLLKYLLIILFSLIISVFLAIFS